MDTNKNNKMMISKKNLTFKKQDILSWLILLPGIILFAFFVWAPLIENIRLSVYSLKGFKIVKFVGLDNYIAVLNHPDFVAAFKNTFLYIGWSLIIGFFAPIIVAILICETTRLKGFFKAAAYFPSMIPGLAVTLIGSFFFAGGDNGVLNILFGKIGLSPQSWLSHGMWTIPIITILCTWRGFGGTSLIYMAAISGINPELYEAAAIDGAGILRRIIHIIMPSLKTIAKSMLLLQVIAVFQILYEPLILTNGGPNNASISVMLLVYNYAFGKYDFSKAAALSVMMSIVLILISVLYTKVTKEKKEG